MLPIGPKSTPTCPSGHAPMAGINTGAKGQVGSAAAQNVVEIGNSPEVESERGDSDGECYKKPQPSAKATNHDTEKGHGGQGDAENDSAERNRGDEDGVKSKLDESDEDI